MSHEQTPEPVHEFGDQPDDHGIWRTGPIWMASDRRLARIVGRPIAGFLKVEAAGGIILLLGAVLALIWANSPWAAAYDALWHTELGITLGPVEIVEDLQHWVNDALMVIFFFVVGLEIKYEIVSGELRDPRSASVPIIAAFGGMVVPAAIYALFTAGGPGSSGWGIPMATDIAFAVGVLGLLGRRIPAPARVFLLTLAIVDDIGAIVVIAVFYTADLSMVWLGVAAAGLLLVVGLRRLRVWSMSVYVVVGLVIWFATYQSGVHATIAGVALGLLAPALPLLDERQARGYAREAISDEYLDAQELRRFRFLLGESVPVAERLGSQLHPWSSYVVLPVFAFANAGITLSADALAALTSPVTAGVALGLLVGKPIGILGACWLAVRLRLGRLPANVGWGGILGLGLVAGIGFTVSLFITGLSFPGAQRLVDDAKVGILGASVLAAALGSIVLVVNARNRAAPVDADPDPASADRGHPPGRSSEREDHPMETAVHNNPDQSRYELISGEVVAGFVEYRDTGEHVELRHTEVDPSYEGEGLGSQLARAVLDSLRNERRPVVPTCPFIRSYMDRHREYAELVPVERRGEFGL